jgi:hypothetical protein
MQLINAGAIISSVLAFFSTAALIECPLKRCCVMIQRKSGIVKAIL